MKKYIKILKRKMINFVIKIIGILTPMLANELKFIRLFKKPLNQKNPQLFAEKIIVRMSSKEFEQLEAYVDKWKVREYVEKVIGSKYLKPLLAVYDNPNDICYEQIPEGAYLKLNHGSHYNIVYTKETESHVKKKIKKWFQTDFSQKYAEQQYKNIKRKILVEENIAPNGKTLYDYSFFTFQGRVEFTQIRDNAGHRYEVGRSYEKLPFQLYSTVTPIEPQQPEYDEMVVLAEKLAQPFDFVRVDFFCVDHKVYFGELTFSPGAGLRMFSPYEYNQIFGEKIHLDVL